jgi:hypothetical protein
MDQGQSSSAQLTLEEQGFIAHVKTAILDNNATQFEVGNLPKGPSQSLLKEFLDLIYKTVKSNKSTADHKAAALKILISAVLHTKLTSLIKLFLSCQMWSFFCKQYRAFFNNGKKSPDEKYSETYFQLLEHMFESFKQDLGIDNNNRETPFLKFWNAVHKRKSDGNPYFTYFVAIVSNTQADQVDTISRMRNEMRIFENSDECNFRVKTLLQSFKSKSANLKFSQDKTQPNFEEVLEFKREFYKLCEKEFYFGDCEAKHYDLFIEIIELEEEKLKYMKSPNQGLGDAQKKTEIQVNSSRFKPQQPSALIEQPRQNANFSNLNLSQRQIQAEPNIRTLQDISRERPQLPPRANDQLNKSEHYSIHNESQRYQPELNNISAQQNISKGLPNQPPLIGQLKNIDQFNSDLQLKDFQMAPAFINSDLNLSRDKFQAPALAERPLQNDQFSILNTSERNSQNFNNQSYQQNIGKAIKLQHPPTLTDRPFMDGQASNQNTPGKLKTQAANVSIQYNDSNKSIYSKINPPSGFDIAQKEEREKDAKKANSSVLDNGKPAVSKFKIFEDSGNKQAPEHFLKGLEEPQKIQNSFHNQSLASIIHGQSQNSILHKSMLDEQGRIRNTVMLNKRRVDTLMQMPFPALKRLKSFAYIKKGSLYKSEICKVGVQVFPKQSSEGSRIITVCCFYEMMTKRSKDLLPKIDIDILSSSKFDLGAVKAANKSEIDISDFCKFGQYPFAQISFNERGRTTKETVEVYIPINKFMNVLRITLADFTSLYQNTEYLLTTNFYRMDYNFFRRGFEFMFVFKNLWPLDVEQRSLGGTIELVGIDERLAMRIIINDIREFKVEVYYNNPRNEEKLKFFLEEMVVLFADRGSL